MIVPRHKLAKALFRLRDEPLSFDSHKYQENILDGNWPKLLLKCSRQVAKSTIDSLLMAIEPILQDGRKAVNQLYVSPSIDQTKAFCIEKLRPLIHRSPKYAKLMTNGKTINDVFTQGFVNGSLIYLRGAYRDAERIRGLAVDKVYIDEIQSMLTGIIPVILSSMDASPVPRTIFSGTPMSMENPIQDYWRQSTQTEWVVPCWRHGTNTGTGAIQHSKALWNKLGVDNIGDNGLICKKCGRPIIASEGVWVDMVDNQPFKGFHISQLGVDMKQSPERWVSDIVYKRDYWEESKFMNETLGESFGQADRPLTVEIMKKACLLPVNKHWDSTKWHDSPPKDKSIKWYAGVDWGEGRESASYDGAKKKNASFTHFIIGTTDNKGIFRPALWKKFKGKEVDPDFIVEYIIDKCREWNVQLMAVDWGFGWGVNSRLAKALGVRKVMQCFHSGNLKPLYRFDNEGIKMVLNRNALISRLVSDVKKGKIGFPKWNVMHDLSKDFTALYTEFNHNTNKLKFDHNMDEPDDGMHTLLYAKFACDYANKRFEV